MIRKRSLQLFTDIKSENSLNCSGREAHSVLGRRERRRRAGRQKPSKSPGQARAAEVVVGCQRLVVPEVGT
jgi:hypothetical protein